jgi:hypothetical protein
LEPNHQAFQGSQQYDRPQKRHWNPDDGMHPEWRPEEPFHQRGTADNNKPEDKHDEYRRAITGVVTAEVQVTRRTRGRYFEISGKKRTVSTSWTPPTERIEQNCGRGTGSYRCLDNHARLTRSQR